MSTYTTERLPGEPIVLQVLYEDWSVKHDLEAALRELAEFLDSAEEPLYYVVDVTRVNVSIDDVVGAASQVARGPAAVLHHPNLKEYVVVTTRGLIKLGAKGLDSELFGFVPVHVCDTLEEALDYVRSRIAGG